MEFKLNKIDTDIRKRMKEETKEDKVHSGSAITIKKDLKHDKDTEEKTNENNKNREKKYITINSIKYQREQVAIEVEKLENIDDANSKGRILDAKK